MDITQLSAEERKALLAQLEKEQQEEEWFDDDGQ